MTWPFRQKPSPQQRLPKALVFKSGEALFETQCEYGVTDIALNQGIAALVLDAPKDLGPGAAVKIEADGRQVEMLKVASDDGGFFTLATTPSGKGDRLKPGDAVIWVPFAYNRQMADAAEDERFGWFGLIRAKLALEMTLEGGLVVMSRFD